MTERYKNRIIAVFLIISASAILFTGCGSAGTERLTSEEVQAIEDYILSSYFILRGDDAIAESRTAWNSLDYPETFPTDSTPVTAFKSNYPEKGQRTDMTIAQTALTDVYKVTCVTTYPSKDSISTTTEVYYVHDEGTAGTYESSDPVVEPDFTGSSWTSNANYRETFETVFDNGTVRSEEIKATMSEDAIQYAEFDYDSGSMSFPEPNQPDGSWAPSYDASAGWSSMVVYEQEEGSVLSIWSGYKNIIGTRYYTEHGSGSSLVRTSVTYEKLIERDASSLSLSENIAIILRRLFNPYGSTDTVYPGETLTETVIRYRITGNHKKEVKSESVIYDSTGGSVVKFTAEYVEIDGTVTSPGEPAAAFY